MTKNKQERSERAKSAINCLIQKGMSFQLISDTLDGLISARTLDRWVKGDTFPFDDHKLESLEELAEKCKD